MRCEVWVPAARIRRCSVKDFPEGHIERLCTLQQPCYSFCIEGITGNTCPDSCGLAHHPG